MVVKIKSDKNYKRSKSFMPHIYIYIYIYIYITNCYIYIYIYNYVYVKTFPWDPVHVEFIYASVCVTKLVSVFTA